MQLRQYQLEAIDNIRAAFRAGKRRVILQLPTGAGKTAVAAEMIRSARAKGNNSIFIADMITLVEQTSERLDEEFIPHGIMQAAHERFRPELPVQVCSIQTLARRKTLEGISLVVIDEVHVLHQAHLKLMDELDCYVVGLSATPWREGLGKHFDALVTGPSVQELIDLGFLVDTRIYAPTTPDLRGIKTIAGDYQQNQLAERMNTKTINGDIIKHWLRLGEGRQTICFAVNVAHSKHIVKSFIKAGIPAGHIDGYMTSPEAKVERRRIMEAFKAGDIKVLSSVAVLSKGFDYPGASCAILARPTKSLMLHIQQLGRIMRISDGKIDAIVLDHAGNTVRLGFPTDELPRELDDGTKKYKQCGGEDEKQEKQPSPCPACSFVRPPGVFICPACGFKPEKQSDVVTLEMDLKQVKKAGLTIAAKQQFFSELLAYAHERRYNAGWASHAYMTRFGVWPASTIKRIPAGRVSRETRLWIAKRNELSILKMREKEQRRFQQATGAM